MTSTYNTNFEFYNNWTTPNDWNIKADYTILPENIIFHETKTGI